jgi:MFS family permease
LLVLAASILFVLLGLIHLPSIALILMLLLGMMLGIVNVVAISTIQLTTPSEIRGRVFVLLITLSNALTPIAMGISGLIADWTGQNIPLIYLICGCISGAIAICLSFSKQLRQFLATEIL